MKLFKFRIQNYKSIVDSRDCYPTDRVTIFAGKNEAGKSSILEALEDFNTNRAIREKAIPISPSQFKPTIEVVFKVSRDEASQIIDTTEISSDSSIELKLALVDSNELTIRKTYPDKYEISLPAFSALSPQKPATWESLVTGLMTVIAAMQAASAARNLGLPKLNVQPFDPKTALEKINQYQTQVEQSSSVLSAEERAQINQQLEQLRRAIELDTSSHTSTLEKLKSAFLKHCPNFVLFSSFDDVFPNEIPLSELATNKWIKDLESMSNIDVSVITGTNRMVKKEHKTELNFQINNDFRQFWTQDPSELSIDWDNERLDFWIQENGKFYSPELRSQGRRWHLAFYIRVAARARGDVSNIILIDEPGLYLHATAQRDILKHLEESSHRCQIFISTHSPYLIESEKLERVRLVLKDDASGTVVENKIHAVSDKETLTPILTAIGLELNQGIVGGDKVNNVVVEGISDYFYLTAFNELFRGMNGHFISGGSSGNMPKIGTILQGWGCKVIYLYDSYQAFQQAKRSIRKDWGAVSSEILMSLNIDGAIEDVFTRDEFSKILEVEPEVIDEKNSSFMKNKKRDKVLPARLYLQKVRANTAPPLSEKTQTTAKALLASLSSKFDHYPV